MTEQSEPKIQNLACQEEEEELTPEQAEQAQGGLTGTINDGDPMQTVQDVVGVHTVHL
jgi:hypothetical protein